MLNDRNEMFILFCLLTFFFYFSPKVVIVERVERYFINSFYGLTA